MSTDAGLTEEEVLLEKAASHDKDAEMAVQRATLVLRLREGINSLARVLKVIEVSVCRSRFETRVYRYVRWWPEVPCTDTNANGNCRVSSPLELNVILYQKLIFYCLIFVRFDPPHEFPLCLRKFCFKFSFVLKATLTLKTPTHI